MRGREGRWEISDGAGLKVQERGEEGIGQNIEQRGRKLRLVVHLLCAVHCTGHFLFILSLE